jgi:glutathione reductase (NADPH)
MKASRDRYIKRLNGIYESGLDKVHIERISGHASLSGKGKVKVTSAGKDTELAADSILIAVGGAPKPLGVAGEEHVIDSDGFFALNSQPKKVGKNYYSFHEYEECKKFSPFIIAALIGVVGAGYIAVELAGVFNGLGSHTSLFVRGDKALRTFDPMIADHLHKSMLKSGGVFCTRLQSSKPCYHLYH